MSRSLQLFDSTIEIDNYNNDFLILKSADRSVIRKIGKAIFYKKFPFVEEVIVTEVEICLKLNQYFDTSKIEEIAKIESGENAKVKTYILPVFFGDQEDWAAVESFIGLEKGEIIASLMSMDFSISMFGFLPGFLYLDGLEKPFHVPRKAVPSKYVKANSVAIGGQYLGVYALDSPGGWHVIGHTPVSVLQTPALPPVLLNLDDRIIIQSIEEEEYEVLLQKNQIGLKEYNA